MKNENNYGKIIAITLSVITCATAIAFIFYRLFRNMMQFFNAYQLEDEDLDLDIAELDEELFEDEIEEPAEEIVIELPEQLEEVAE